jgi:hypothetical protein
MRQRSIEILLIIILLMPVCILAQTSKKTQIKGRVTYQSGQNVYVGFESTNGISPGDTLFLQSGRKLVPAVIAKYISSISCAGKKITDSELSNKDIIVAFVAVTSTAEKNKNNTEQDSTLLKELSNNSNNAEENFKPEKKTALVPTQKIDGRFSVQSYSNLTNTGSGMDYQRWRYTFRFNAQNINDGGLSLSTYSTFTYRADQWNYISSNLGQAVRIYDLTLGYRFNPSTRVWVGRYLNPKISSLSSVDGVQFEKYFNSVYTGVVVGSRPDYIDMGVNSQLFEGGVYVGKTDTLGNGVMDNTISVFNQMNHFKTDRRFIYLQHTDNIFKNTNIFASSEVDIYKREYNIGKNDFSLTSLYLTARYAPVRQVSFFLSYDARKNVIYYETFKTFIDSIVERETRQGVRGRINFRPVNRLNLAVEGGYRYQRGDVRPTRNFSGFISYSSLPLVEVSTSLSYTRLITGYLEGNIESIFLSKNIFNSLVTLSVGLRNIDYNFTFNNFKVNQRSLETDLAVNLSRYLYLTLSYDGEFEQQSSFSRIFLGLTTRF